MPAAASCLAGTAPLAQDQPYFREGRQDIVLMSIEGVTPITRLIIRVMWL
jgi:hypothetical protein